jgi:hypothetical protein
VLHRRALEEFDAARKYDDRDEASEDEHHPRDG